MQYPEQEAFAQIVQSDEAETVIKLKAFFDGFRHPDRGFIYRSSLTQFNNPVLNLQIEHLPPELGHELQLKPMRTRELIIRAAKETAGRDIPVQINGAAEAALEVKEISAGDLEKLVSVKGLILGASKTRPKITKMVAHCRTCRHKIEQILPFGAQQLRLPGQCKNQSEEQKCPPNPYAIVEAECGYSDSQQLRLTDAERSSLSVFLEENLVDNELIAGQHVVVTGVLRQHGLLAFGCYQAENNLRLTYSEADFRDFAAQGLPHLVTKIASHLHGLDSLKLAIACQQVCGTSKLTSERTRLRGEINILMLADPGVGKSELLKTACLLSKTAVQTSGRGTSAAGLTAAVIKDQQTGEFLLEGGALVLADGGILAIDEFDKCRQEDVVALHEAMEQGTVSVNKASVQAVLSTRVSVLAAANPSFGRYDELRGLSEQIDLQATIASRFDLIFFLKDVIDVERDSLVVQKIGETVMGTEGQKSYQFLKQYFEFCRKIQPKLSVDAGQFLKDFYVKLRRQESTLTVTVRQLEALIRLSEAVAKLRCKQTVSVQEAETAIELFRASTGDAATVGITEQLSKVTSLQVAEAQKVVRQRLLTGQAVSEPGLINELKQMGTGEGAAARAILLLIGSGEVQRGRGRTIVRVK